MTRLASATGWFFGWKVVAVSFLIAVFAWGLGFYGPSIYVNELVGTRGWPIAIVSGAVTFHFVFSAVLVIFLADAHDRFGVVGVTRAGLVAFGLGAIAWAWAPSPWHLYPAAALTGIGWSATSGAAINTFVAPWFERRRAIALSHAYNGASIGGVLMTPLWVALIAWLGFEGAALAVAIGGVVLLWPLAGRYLRPTPETLGLARDGDAAASSVATAASDTAPPMSRSALMADAAFLSLSVAFAIGIFAQMGLITHLVVRLAPELGNVGAAAALSLATACAIIGRFGLAALIGADGRRRAAAMNFLIQAIGSTLLVIGGSPEVLIAGCVFFGLGIGNLLSLPPLILQSERRAIDVGRALALLTAVNQVLYAFAPGVFGVARAWTGDYTMPFIAAGLLQVLSAVVVVMVRAPRLAQA